MRAQAFSQAATLQLGVRDTMLERPDAIRGSLHGVVWGVSYAVNEIWHDEVG